MPLNTDALDLIRHNLEILSRGERAPRVTIGYLTATQLKALNEHRLASNPDLKPMEPEVIFIGRHVFRRRIQQDGYTVEDILDQISAALEESSVFDGGAPMQRIKSVRDRSDRYGNTRIRDCVVLECTAHRPYPELFSVIPKGDHHRPVK